MKLFFLFLKIYTIFSTTFFLGETTFHQTFYTDTYI